jgi:EAL domain-containing protein (putative c-di-GMP-specific phosphodiesterase class I)
LRAAGFVTLVKMALERADIPASALEFEITEGMVSRDSDSAVAILGELADMGIGLAMDDFGTGTSSLSVIRRFPIDSIKIDRTFIADIATDDSCLEITRAIISMGHALGRRIIAEGVETTDQISVLRQLGCDEIQGYVLAPPVPADQLATLLTTPPHL